jgi:hypothetical protein
MTSNRSQIGPQGPISGMKMQEMFFETMEKKSRLSGFDINMLVKYIYLVRLL